jgi:hypothetical protein
MGVLMNEKQTHVGLERCGGVVQVLCLLEAAGEPQRGRQVDEVVVLRATLLRARRVHHALQKHARLPVTLLLHQKLACNIAKIATQHHKNHGFLCIPVTGLFFGYTVNKITLEK